MEHADGNIIVIDATEGVTEQMQRSRSIALEGKALSLQSINKWDAIEKDDKTIYRHTEKITSDLKFIPYAEILFISAKIRTPV